MSLNQRTITQAAVIQGSTNPSDVAFIGSAPDLDTAQTRKRNAQPVSGTTIVIFHTRGHNGKFVLWQTDPPPPSAELEPGGGREIGWDLFRVPDWLLEQPARATLIETIERLLLDFGQQGDPSGIQPR